MKQCLREGMERHVSNGVMNSRTAFMSSHSSRRVLVFTCNRCLLIPPTKRFTRDSCPLVFVAVSSHLNSTIVLFTILRCPPPAPVPIPPRQAHATALLLNEAYDTLMDDRRRAAYEREWRYASEAGYAGFTGQARSKWRGPEGMEQAFFVDEMTCVGE